ncbi:host-nuclease inhibitor Gam family protein [Orenia marismortui]|uniref:Gam-like protein n=1 Tax=Orenia marismortui TaxID=46469 RepID=A0A4V6QB73_9FIRM|nr:host-nuclease inhibitor Gam family protein [Orenia marismortui]TDX49122.1 Gam-like protein [Orenia marismortui]
MNELKEEMKENQEQERFVITDDAKADWALEKLRELEAKKKDKEEIAAKRKEMIDNWLEQETETINKSIDYFKGILTEYAMKLKEQDPELKTHKLPFGALRFRSQRPKWNYDNDKLVESVEGAGLNDLIKVDKSVNKREFKKLVEVVNGMAINKDTGEVIEGVTIEERDEKFSIDI